MGQTALPIISWRLPSGKWEIVFQELMVYVFKVEG